MAQPTKEQVAALEKAHKQLFFVLVNLAKKHYQIKNGSIPALPTTDPKRKAWDKFDSQFRSSLLKWTSRHNKLQSKLPQEEKIYIQDFLKPERFSFLNEQLSKWMAAGVKGTLGLGFAFLIPFIPQIIWGFTAIVGLFTANQIVDELNTTNEEAEKLLKTAEETAEAMGLKGDEKKKFIEDFVKGSQSATKGSGFTEDIGTAVKWGVGLLVVGGATWLGFELFGSKKK